MATKAFDDITGKLKSNAVLPACDKLMVTGSNTDSNGTSRTALIFSVGMSYADMFGLLQVVVEDIKQIMREDYESHSKNEVTFSKLENDPKNERYH